LILFIHDGDKRSSRGKSLLPFAFAAAPGGLPRIDSSPMDDIASVADVRIPTRRRAQRGQAGLLPRVC
jgi:hypothetical protein